MIGHAVFHTYELVIPIFLVIWLDSFTASPAVLGTIVGAGYALSGFGALPSGIVVDHVSSKLLVIASMAGMGGAFLIVAIAPNVIILTVGLLAWGLAASLYHPAGLALISRGAKQRATSFAYHGAAGNVGVATGPLLATVLLVFFDWRLVAALLALPVVAGILVASRLRFDETAGTAERQSGSDGETLDGIDGLGAFVSRTKVLFTSAFALVFLIGILYGIYYRGAFTFLPDVLAGLPLFESVTVRGFSLEPSRYVYSGLLLLGGIGQFVGGTVTDRIRTEYALLGGYGVLIAVGLTFIPAAQLGLVPLLFVGALLAFFVYVVAPINQEAISKYSPAGSRGLSFGYTYAGLYGIGAVGATMAGVVLTRWSAGALFAILAGVACMAAILVAALLGKGE